ncbi:MAG: hypothetical protein Kow00121_59700 [Elainellaceae cyanobacterium]
MVEQTLDSVTPNSLNCHDRDVYPSVPASRLQAGQQVQYNGTLLKVRRVIPAFTRAHGCHVHLVPVNWQPLEGADPQLADRDEATVLVRVSCPTFKTFEVVA